MKRFSNSFAKPLAILILVLIYLGMINLWGTLTAPLVAKIFPSASLPWWLQIDILPLHWYIATESMLIWGALLYSAISLILLFVSLLCWSLPFLALPWTLWDLARSKRRAVKALEDMHLLIDENSRLKEKISLLSDQLSKYIN